MSDAIKKEPRLAAVPVIVYTTPRDVRESVKLKQLGAAHFMSKPVIVLNRPVKENATGKVAFLIF